MHNHHCLSLCNALIRSVLMEMTHGKHARFCLMADGFPEADWCLLQRSRWTFKWGRNISRCRDDRFHWREHLISMPSFALYTHIRVQRHWFHTADMQNAPCIFSYRDIKKNEILQMTHISCLSVSFISIFEAWLCWMIYTMVLTSLHGGHGKQLEEISFPRHGFFVSHQGAHTIYVIAVT